MSDVGGEEFVAALRSGDMLRCLELVAQAPELLRTPIGGVSPVLMARYHGQVEIALELLQRRSAPDLHEAAALGQVDALMGLLAADRSGVDVPGADGHRPLGLAAFFAQPEAVELLLEAGADPNAPAENAMRVTALHAATAGGNLRCVRAVLEAGAAPDVRQQGGWTPLHAAAQAGRQDLIAVLLECGADPHATNDEGATPAELAHQAGHEPIAKWLRMQPRE